MLFHQGFSAVALKTFWTYLVWEHAVLSMTVCLAAAPSVIIWEPLAAREQPARGTEDTPPEVKHLALPVRSELNQFVPKG